MASGAGTTFPAAPSPTSSPTSSPGTGKAVVLMAHSDSVAAGPGAGDDGSGVAILLETIRALKARGTAASGEHPVVAAVHRRRGERACSAPACSCAIPLRRGQDRRGDQCGGARQSGTQLSVPDQHRRRQADRSLCPQRAALCDVFALWRDLQISAQRHRPDAGAGGGHSPATISPSSATSRSITPRWTGARISIPRSLQQQGDNVLALTDSAVAMPTLASLKGGGRHLSRRAGALAAAAAAAWALPLAIAGLSADRAGGLSDAARPARPAAAGAGGRDAAAAAGGRAWHGLCAARHGGAGFPASPIRLSPIRWPCACRWPSASLRWRCWSARRARRHRLLAVVCGPGDRRRDLGAGAFAVFPVSLPGRRAAAAGERAGRARRRAVHRRAWRRW